MKKALALILTLAMMTGVMAGCSQKPAGNPSTSTPPASTSTDTPAGPAAPAAGEIPNTFNYEVVENTTGKEIRIAVLTTQTNAFWVDVCQGTEDVKAFLGQDKYNCTVDMQTFDTFDGQAVSEAIDTCITMEYDAICTVGVADSIASSISKAVAAGIPVYLFNSNTGVDNEATAPVWRRREAGRHSGRHGGPGRQGRHHHRPVLRQRLHRDDRVHPRHHQQLLPRVISGTTRWAAALSGAAARHECEVERVWNSRSYTASSTSPRSSPA